MTLEWRAVQDNVIRLRPEIATNKDGRVMVMVEEVANILARQRAERVESCPHVFHWEGKRMKYYNRAWRTACKKAGLPGRFFPHARRTVARNMDRANGPRQTAKQIIGHKTDAKYNRYRIVNEQDIREGMVQVYLASQNLGYGTDK